MILYSLPSVVRRAWLRKPLASAVCIAMGVSTQHTIADELNERTVLPLLDWQPLISVPVMSVDKRCRQCDGQFIDPLANIDTSIPPTDSDLEVNADNSEVTETELTFVGNVRVQQGYRRVSANQVTIDRAGERAVASGDVTFREPGVVITGDSVIYDSISEVAQVNAAQYLLHNRQLSGTAATLSRDANGEIEVTDGAMTYCAPHDPTWILEADKLDIDPNSGDGQAWGATLRVADVPIFYLPWIRFPVDSRRKSGLLFPDIGSDSRGGVDITQPIYFNLAPHYDALYQPRYIQERGLLHQAKGRWLDETTGYWELTGGWISNDEKYEGETQTDGQRWLLAAQHAGQHGDAWRTTVKYTRVSDAEYVRDLENHRLSAQRQTALQQLGRVEWLGESWQVRLDVEQFQSLAQDIRNDYKKLPQMTARWRGQASWLGVEPLFLAQLSHFDTDAARVTGQRLYTEAGLTLPKRWQAGFLTSTLKYRSVSYELDDFPLLDDTSPSAGSIMASVDGGLIFDRQTQLGGMGMTQTLEPRAYFLYSQFEDQTGHPDFDSAELTFTYNQLYRDTRFSGNDRIDDANQLSLGVTTRFIENETGETKLEASLGQIFYFRDREVRLNRFDPDLDETVSAIAAEATWYPSSQWRLRSSLLYDPNENTFDAAYAQANYQPGNGAIFNLGYTLREPPPSLIDRPVTEQATVSAYYPVNDTWSLFGAYEYSLEASEVVESMVGFEYDDCCWRVRLLYMRYIDTLVGDIPDFTDPNLPRENSFQLQVMLKGMGGFGGRVDELLSDMIRGFKPQQ